MLQTKCRPDGVLLIDARSLYEALTNDRKFMRWCSRHFIKEEETVEGLDYFKFEDEEYRSGPNGKFVKYRSCYGVSIALAIRLCNLDEKYSEESDNTALVLWLSNLQDEQYHKHEAEATPKQERPAYVSTDTSEPLAVEKGKPWLWWEKAIIVILVLAIASAWYVCS